MRKKKTRLLLFSIILGAIFIAGIIVNAASKSHDSVQNRLQIPVIQGEIKETFTPNIPIKIGGMAQTKEINVENKGNTPFFVRVMVFPEITTDSDDLLASNIGKEVILDINTDWIDGKDGFFYYKKTVLPGKMASNVFETVKLSDTLDESYSGANLSIQIKIETVTNSSHQYRKVWWGGDINTVPTDSILNEIDDSLDSLVSKP